MTRSLPDETRAGIGGVTERPARRAFVDVFRGLLIAHMALDHASLLFNAGRSAEELAAGAAPAAGDLWQFLTRFTGVPVAPGFFMMAGFMVAMTSAGRADRGVSRGEITRRLVTRGLVLIAVDALIMGLPRALMGFYSFMVLTCIGVGIIALAFLRHLPARWLLAGALAVLALHPLLDVSALPTALRAILYEPVRTGAFRSLYPIVPWVAIVVLGFVVGRDALARQRPARLWLTLAAAAFALFLVVRLAGGYGNTWPYSGAGSFEFWTFAKYPPDLAFLTWSLACVFLALAALAKLVPGPALALLRPFEVFGRVPFFFYVVHFYVLGIAAAVVHTRFGLPEVYLIWLALLVAMYWPCAWYYRRKLERPNLVTRYF